MTLNAYANRFRSVKRSNPAMSWNAWDISTALFPVLPAFRWNNMASAVENTSWKPLEVPFPRFYFSKCSQVPQPSRSCAVERFSKAAYYSLSACYFKTFWQPWTKMNMILFLFLVNLLLCVCVFQCEGKEYNHKSDMWALGCILYEMASRQKTFEGSNLPALVNKIMKVQENSDLVKFSRMYR